ncbi:hypothetical protein JCM8097_001994 [Rhodosporidiobolus ruineniae]
MSDRLPVPPLDGPNPYAAYRSYLDRIIQVRIQDHSQSVVALVAVLSYAIFISLVHFGCYWRSLRKEHKPLWFVRLVKRPQGRYITLNQTATTTLVNIVVLVLWLLYAIWLHFLWDPSLTVTGRFYLYFINTSVTLVYIPLFLVTFLLISAGNLTSSHKTRPGQHCLPPWAINSLLLLFPAMFILLFVPGIVAGHKYSDYIDVAQDMRDEANRRAAIWDATTADRTAVVDEIISYTYAYLNPIRMQAWNTERKARICQLPPFAILIILNLLGFFFILRHLRQDRSGQLVFHGTSVVAPLTSLAADPSSVIGSPSSSAGETEPKQDKRFSRTLTKNTVDRARDEREAYEKRVDGLQREADARAPWDVMLNYFCVVPICLLVFIFVSWVISVYGYNQKFNDATTAEIAATSHIWAYTLVHITATTALVLKRLFTSSSRREPASQHVENPFNTRTGRRRETDELGMGGVRRSEGDEEDDRDEEEGGAVYGGVRDEVDLRSGSDGRRKSEKGEEREREKRAARAASPPAGAGRRPSFGRKLSIVSLASSVGSRFSFSGASSTARGAEGGRRGSVQQEKMPAVAAVREEEQQPHTLAGTRGHGEPQSLMAHVVEMRREEGGEGEKRAGEER